MEETQKKYVYVIIESTGEYEDKYDRPICVVDTEDDAKSHIKTLKEALEKRDRLAIKDVFSEYGNEDVYDFTHMLDEFKDQLIKKLFPRFNEIKDVDEVYLEEELTEEEADIFYRLSEQEELSKWMKETKGYSDDVISATIEYNYSSYDERDPYYHYRKVPFKS